jgi:molecular chaperone DnaJ
MAKDYYATLGVQPGATGDEVKAAFRRLAQQYHPDVNKEPGAEEHFKEVNEAYAVLSDPEKRAAYDRYGEQGLEGFGGAPDFSSFDVADLFNEFFGFGGMGSRTRQRNAPRRGADLSYSVSLSFEEAIFGLDKEVEFSRDEVCSTCRGSKAEPGTRSTSCSTCGGRGEVRQTRQTLFGAMVQVTTCPTCNGSGEVISTPCHTCRGRGLERKVVKKIITIPGGVDNGTQVRLAGEGQPGANGGPNGNLLLEIQVRPHQFFQRKGDDVLLNLKINVAQATLGAEIDVPTVEGKSKLNVPAGTQPGKVFTLKGKGSPHVRSSGRGDQLIMVNVEVPNHLTPEQRELFEKLAASLGSEVSPQDKNFWDVLKEVFGG